MKQTPTNVQDLAPFANALHLYPTVESVVEHNVTKLKNSSQPIATIKAVHTGANAAKASSDDASGLEAVVCLAKSARVTPLDVPGPTQVYSALDFSSLSS